MHRRRVRDLCGGFGAGIRCPERLLGAQKKSEAKHYVVTIKRFVFEPATLEVRVGDTVEWKNEDLVEHTATAADSATFDSGTLAPRQSWKHEVSQAGSFPYVCSLHPEMKAVLVVKPRR